MQFQIISRSFILAERKNVDQFLSGTQL